jgi:hypothetical protein
MVYILSRNGPREIYISDIDIYSLYVLNIFMTCVVSVGLQKWVISVNEKLCDFDNLVNFGVEKHPRVIIFNS